MIDSCTVDLQCPSYNYKVNLRLFARVFLLNENRNCVANLKLNRGRMQFMLFSFTCLYEDRYVLGYDVDLNCLL